MRISSYLVCRARFHPVIAWRWHWLAAGFAALAATLAHAAPAAVAAAPHARIDLDAFDAAKKHLELPNGEQLAYVEWGDPAGHPVILIHGFTDSARDWAPMLPYVSKRTRWILVDIRGHGASSKPECCYTRLDFAYDVKLLLDALQIPKADVVGHSLGTIIAQTLAEYWPQRIGRVVLVSSTGGLAPNVPAHAPQFDFEGAIKSLHEPIEADSPFMIAWWDSPTPVDPDFIARERRDAAAIPLRVWLAVLDQASINRDNYADLQRTLPRLGAPTLLIWGSEDPIMEPPMRDSLRRALPNARVKIFPGLGHNPFWEDPAAVAREIEAFL